MPRATAAEQIRRNQRIVTDRARGYTWAAVAKRNGVTARRAQQVVREHRESLDLRPTEEDERVVEAIEFTVQAIEDLAMLAETTRNDAIRLGAINSRLKALERLVALLQATEILPTRLHLTEAHMALERNYEAMSDAFARFGEQVPPDVFAPIWDAYTEIHDDASTARATKEAARRAAQQKKAKRTRELEAEARDQVRREESRIARETA